jgi:uncharacterized membrane protein YbhN (UPF0104 family)
MASRAPALDRGAARGWSRLATGLVKATIGLGLITALVLIGRLDLRALAVLPETPGAIALSGALILLTLPLAALRWGLVLRSLGLSLPFASLFHFVAIALLANLFSFGPSAGDAIRGIYAWRAIGGASARVAVSILAERLLTLLALLSVSLMFTAFNWERMQHVPALAVLGSFLSMGFAAGIVVAFAVWLAPLVTQRLAGLLSRWPRLAEGVGQIHGLLVLFRNHPFRLLSAFALAVAIQTLTVAGIVVLAEAMDVGRLRAADFLFAVPLTLLVNAVPLTPNGIGIGEAAFDQICRWLEPLPSGAAYSSVFFAYRAISLAASLTGLISFIIYRNKARPDPA